MDVRAEHQVVKTLLPSFSAMLCAFGPTGRLWRVGVAGQRVRGYAFDELCGAILHPDYSGTVVAARQQAAPVGFGGRGFTESGQEVALAWSAF